MKDSKEYSKKVKKVFRSLKTKYGKPEKKVYEEPVDALVYGVLSEHVTEREAQERLAKFEANFVDWNDLRVSLEQEILEVLGSDSEEAKLTASKLCSVLGGVFKATNTVTLESLYKQGKRPARGVLEKIAGISPFVVDYCMLTALDAHAMPLTAMMVRYLRENELVHPEADEQDIAGFLTRLIPASNGYDFYALLRQESEDSLTKKKRRKRKTVKKKAKKAVKKTKKKAKKKTKKKLKKKTKTA